MIKSTNRNLLPRRLYTGVTASTPPYAPFRRLLPAFLSAFLKKPVSSSEGEQKKEWRSEIQLKKGYTPSKKKEDKIFYTDHIFLKFKMSVSYFFYKKAMPPSKKRSGLTPLFFWGQKLKVRVRSKIENT